MSTSRTLLIGSLDRCKIHSRSTCWAPQMPSAGLAGGIDNLVVKTGRIAAVATENLGKCVVFSDVDIQFFSPILPVVESALENRDIVFQRERPERGVNTGFMAIRCSRTTVAFWVEVLDALVRCSRRSRAAAIRSPSNTWSMELPRFGGHGFLPFHAAWSA